MDDLDLVEVFDGQDTCRLQKADGKFAVSASAEVASVAVEAGNMAVDGALQAARTSPVIVSFAVDTAVEVEESLRSDYALWCAVVVAEARTSPVIVSFAADTAVEAEGSLRSGYVPRYAVGIVEARTADCEAGAAVAGRQKGEQRS